MSGSLTATDKQVLAKLNAGISYGELLDLVAPAEAPTDVATATPPAPPVITEADREAVGKLLEVYGKVAPDTRRALMPTEIEALGIERDTIDTVAKLIERRKKAIRATLLNHFDIEAEKQKQAKGAEKDDEGHYLLDQAADATVVGRTFRRAPRGGTASLSEASLKALVDDPDHPEFGHDDYLAMTRQVRVLDEAQALAHLRDHPDLLAAVGDIAAPATKTTYLTFNRSK